MQVTIGRYRLVPRDSRNYELYIYKEPERIRAFGKDYDKSARWIAQGEYFQTLSSALSRIYEYVLRDDDSEIDVWDIDELVSKVERVKDELLSATIVTETDRKMRKGRK